MSLLGLSTATSTPPEEEAVPADKKPKKLYFAIYYDGTMNDRTNIEAREKNDEESYRKFKKENESWWRISVLKNTLDSFENGRTNIAIMESHTKDDPLEGYDLFKSFYIPGSGTFDLKPDKLKGYAFALGESGIRDRGKLGIQWVFEAVRDMDYEVLNPDKYFIEKVTIDVFGFSRGAATARYAISLLLKEQAFSKRLETLGYEGMNKKTVEVGFAGLYDTVVSYAGSQTVNWTDHILGQTGVKYAKKALHLTASDEHRKDFRLYNINSAKSKTRVDDGHEVGEEYYLPGVHADVGGSYNKADEEVINNETDPAKKEKLLMLFGEEDQTINKGDLWEMEADKKWLIDQGWYKGSADTRSIATIKADAKKTLKKLKKRKQREVEIKDGNFTIKLSFRERHHDDDRRHLDFRFLSAKLHITRAKIDTGYSNIPLKIMHDYVKKHTKLIIKDEILERANTIIKNSNLTPIETKIKSYVAKQPINSTAEDWLNSAWLKQYRYQYFNFSAFWETGYYPRFDDNDNRKRYTYDA